MAEIIKEKGKVFLELNEKDMKELGSEKNFFELNKIKNVFVLTEAVKSEKEVFDEETQETDEKIFGLLTEKGKDALKMKVEGEFEKQLKPEELKRFNELLKQGLIEKFKLNESYKKAIYQIARKKQKEKKDFDVNSIQKTIESNGFEVIINDNQAKNFCQEFNAEIKENLIKGIKGFDGYFYVIYSNLLEELKPKILIQFKGNKTVSLKELTEKTSLPLELIKGITEFLKEDGDILEKRKGIYQLIE